MRAASFARLTKFRAFGEQNLLFIAMRENKPNHAPLFIIRQNARSVVMMSEEEYEGLMETVHLLKSPANAARMLRSIQDADQDKLTERELIDPGKAGA